MTSDGGDLDGDLGGGGDLAGVAGRIGQHRDQLSPAERRVAEVVLRDPQGVAFGTVARVAARAGTSGASVVRLATRLGYSGFSELQGAVQAAIGQQLGPAVERIRSERGSDVVSRTLRAELGNVQRTLEGVEPEAFARAVGLLADEDRPVRVLAGDAEAGIGAMAASLLSMLRDDVTQVGGSEAAVVRQLAALAPGAVVVAIDLRRYERWVLDSARRALASGAHVLALTDGVLSPLAARAEVSLTVAAEGAGPFDSHVGTLAVVNALVTGVAGTLRHTATRRLERLEALWGDAGVLLDG